MAGLNLFTNNAATTLASSLTNVATTITVAAGTGSLFPTLTGSQYCYCTLANNAGTVEIVKVTARSTDTFTVVRGQDGTSAVAWNSGDKFELRLVRASLVNFPQLDSDNTFAGLQTFSNTGIFSIGTNQFYKDASGNIGIGTTSITAIYGTTLQIGNSATNSTLSITGSGAGTTGDVYLAGTVDTALLYARSSTPLTFGTNDIERMRITSAGGISFGSSGTAYGTSGQVLQSNGDAPPSWVTFNTLGGATETTTSSDITLTSSSNRVQRITQTAANKSINLPAGTTFSNTGSPIFNLQASGNFMYFKYSDGYRCGSITPGVAGTQVSLSNNTNAQTGYAFNDIAPPIKEADESTSGTTILAAAVSGGLGYINGISVDQLDTNKFIVGYQLGTTCYAVVATQSGTSFTFGTPLALGATATSSNPTISVVALSTTTAFLFMSETSQADCYGLTISGTTVTASAMASFNGNRCSISKAFKLTSTTALIASLSQTTSAYPNWRVCQHNGASAPTFGSNVAASNQSDTNGSTLLTCELVAGSKYFSVWTNTTGGNGNYAVVLTISGLTITKGTEVLWFSNGGGGGGGGKSATINMTQYGCLAYSSTEVFVPTDKGYGYFTISGSTITVAGTLSTISTGLTTTCIQVSNTTLMSNQALITYSGSGSYLIKLNPAYTGQNLTTGFGSTISGSSTSFVNCGGQYKTNYPALWITAQVA